MAQMPNTPHIAGLGFRETLNLKPTLLRILSYYTRVASTHNMSSNFEDCIVKNGMLLNFLHKNCVLFNTNKNILFFLEIFNISTNKIIIVEATKVLV
jgi:hypothetical protein